MSLPSDVLQLIRNFLSRLPIVWFYIQSIIDADAGKVVGLSCQQFLHLVDTEEAGQ